MAVEIARGADGVVGAVEAVVPALSHVGIERFLHASREECFENMLFRQYEN